MPLLLSKTVYKTKFLQINQGLSEKSGKEVLQIVLISPTTKAAKAINLGAGRSGELADALEAAAKSIRRNKPADKGLA